MTSGNEVIGIAKESGEFEFIGEHPTKTGQGRVLYLAAKNPVKGIDALINLIGEKFEKVPERTSIFTANAVVTMTCNEVISKKEGSPKETMPVIVQFYLNEAAARADLEVASPPKTR